METDKMLQVFLDGDPVVFQTEHDVRALIAFLEHYASLKALTAKKPAKEPEQTATGHKPKMKIRVRSSASRGIGESYVAALRALGGKGTGEQIYKKLLEMGVDLGAKDPLAAVKTYLRQPGKFRRVGVTTNGSAVWALLEATPQTQSPARVNMSDDLDESDPFADE